MPDVLIQTRIPPKTSKWLKEQADAEGDSVAGKLRRLVVAEASRTVVQAWVVHQREADPEIIMGRGVLPHFQLQVLSQLAEGDILVRVYSSDRKAVSGDFWRSTTMFPHLDEHRVVMKGSHKVWRIVSSMENVQLKAVELRLQPLDQRAITAFKVEDLKGGGARIGVVYVDGEILVSEVASGAAGVPPSLTRPGWTVDPNLVFEALRKLPLR